MQPSVPRNVMDEILYGKEEGVNGDSLTETSQLFYLFSAPTKKKKQEKKRRHSAVTKRKVTHYLGPGTREELDKLREQLLRLFPEIGKNTFSRSNIVDKTLESVIKRFHCGQDWQELLQLLLAGRKNNSSRAPSLEL